MSEAVPSVLSVGLIAPSDNDRASYVNANSGSRALELMNLLHFDLLVVAPRLGDLSIAMLVRQARIISPWMKWVLAGPGITSQDEIAARCNGVLAVLDDLNDWTELESLASSARRHSYRPVAIEA